MSGIKENGQGQERMVGVCEGEGMGRSQGDEPLTFTRCHSCGLSQLYEALEGGSPSVAETTT